MPMIKLSKEIVKVGLRHTKPEEIFFNVLDGQVANASEVKTAEDFWAYEPRRGTEAWLNRENGTGISVMSICNPMDNFERSAGRSKAVTKLVQRMAEQGYSKEDRRTVAHFLLGIDDA